MSDAFACSLLYMLWITVHLSGALPSSGALTPREKHPQHRGHRSPHFTVRNRNPRLSASETTFASRDSYINRSTQNSLQKQSENFECGDGYCYCDDEFAFCSGHKGGLSYIPALPDTIRHLLFLRNKLTSIENEQFFANVSNATSVDLRENDIAFINFDALIFLKNLKKLYLDENIHLSLQALKAVFSVPTLRLLSLTKTRLGPALPADIVPSSPELPLKTLRLDGNYLNSVNLSMFTRLVKIKTISLSANSLGHSLTTDYLPNLRTLFLGSTSLYVFPRTCRNGTSLFPRLAELFLDENHLTTVPVDICLPSLKYLTVASNSFATLEPYWFSSRSFPVLKTLDLRASNYLRKIEKNAFSNPSLKYLLMSYCRLDLGFDSSLDADSFAGCENLTSLVLSYNQCNSMTDSRFKRLFGNLTSLTWLDLKNVGLDQISSETFSCLTSVEKFHLEGNKLGDLPDGAFDGMTRLTYLWLTSNKMSVVRPEAFGEATKNRLHRLDISGNPFSCSCDVLWLQQWMASNPSLFSNPLDQYMCANIPHMTVQSFHIPEQACLLSRQTSLLIIVVIGLVLSMSTLGTSLYRCRWHLRLLLYEAFRGKGERWRRLQEEHFQYDIFVSYDSKDVEWVLGVLVPELEDRWGLRLCIHQRDFIPGRQIVDNIETCVVASKKIMMLFSKNFADSGWCQFELNLCLRQVMDYDDTLLVVLLHDIPSRDLTPTMMAVMHTTTYIEWGRSHDAVAAFWGRLRIALHEIMP